MEAPASFLGIDIGGSSVKVGVVTSEGTVLSHRQSPLPLVQSRDAALDQVFEDVHICLRTTGLTLSEIRGVGIAAPGTMDLQAGVLLQAVNLPGWEDLPLRRIAEERLGLPAVLVNDANAAAYGEYWVGAARDARSLMFWTLGTGVGGGIVLNGELLEGAHGHAGECGHMIIQSDGGLRSEHGIHGALELYAGARGLVRRCTEALRSGRLSRLREIAERQAITPLDIAAEAEAGDELALELILDTARYIGVGTVNILHILNPEMVLIGGAMTFGQGASPVGRRFLERVRETVRELAFPIPAARTRIDFAALGNAAGFIGAAGCALRRVVRRWPR
jgi:glucokinase